MKWPSCKVLGGTKHDGDHHPAWSRSPTYKVMGGIKQADDHQQAGWWPPSSKVVGIIIYSDRHHQPGRWVLPSKVVTTNMEGGRHLLAGKWWRTSRLRASPRPHAHSHDLFRIAYGALKALSGLGFRRPMIMPDRIRRASSQPGYRLPVARPRTTNNNGVAHRVRCPTNPWSTSSWTFRESACRRSLRW